MRNYFLFCLCIFGLTGCVNYLGMKGHSSPLTVSKLSTPHVYNIPPRAYAINTWWSRFHDPQLNQLIAVALSGSPDMKVAKNRVRRAQYLAKEAGADLWPSIDMSGYVQRQKFAKFGLVPPPFNGKTFNIGEVGLNFNYEFDFWGKNRETLAAKVNEACAVTGDLYEAALIISTSVASVYFQLQYNMAEMKNAQAVLHQRQALSEIVKNRGEHGIVSEIPIKTAHADTQSAILAIEEYRQAAELARHQLAVLIGKNPLTTEIEVPNFSYHASHVALPACLPAHLLSARPDVFAARERAYAAAHQINVAKAYFFPDINLNILFSYQSVFLNRLFLQSNQNNAITGAFDLPIFDANARRANLGAKFAEYDVAVNQYNQTILNALRDVADQLSILHTLNAELSAEQRVLSATERNYKLTRSRYHHGIVDYSQVLDIQGTLLQQQATQIDLQARHLLAVVAMIKALGGYTVNPTPFKTMAVRQELKTQGRV